MLYLSLGHFVRQISEGTHGVAMTAPLFLLADLLAAVLVSTSSVGMT